MNENKNLTPDEKKRLLTNFTGYDIEPEMVRLSLVNLYLHGFSDPKIYEYDTLTSSIDSGCEYAILGDNRYEKIVNFMSYMNLVFPNNDHGHTVIPALGHTSNTFSSNIFKEYLNSIF